MGFLKPKNTFKCAQIQIMGLMLKEHKIKIKTKLKIFRSLKNK